jgi:thioredoxin-related protein
MRKIILILLFHLSAMAQGIHFEENLSWQQVQAKAKTEHKYIFMDCFATWCVPCKYMSNNVFTQKEVGDLVNQSFISVSVQMDVTPKDNDTVKSWYADAKQLMKDYQVTSLPTYLFFDPDGHIVHRAGGAMPASAFIEMAKDASDTAKQFYPLYHKYQQGYRDSAMLKQLIISSLSTGDEELTGRFINDYISNIKNVYAKDNLEFIGQLTKNSEGKGFELWRFHTIQVDKVMGMDYAERKIMNVIMNEDENIIAANQKAVQGLKMLGTMGGRPFYGAPDKNAKEPVPPDWKNLYTGVKLKYGVYYADRITKNVKIGYYSQRQDWPDYDLALVAYLRIYASTVKPAQLNDWAWDIFTHSADKRQLAYATGWSKTAIATSEKNPKLNQYIDTYANLLYKSGRRDEAIKQEKTALRIAVSEQDKKSLTATLDKMKKGEKTW